MKLGLIAWIAFLIGCKTPGAGESDLRQIDATQGEANGLYMGYATYISAFAGLTSIKSPLIPAGVDPAKFGIREENFTAKKFVENYYSRKEPFTGGLWNAFFHRFTIDHLQTNFGSIAKDQYDEMIFYFSDAEGKQNAIGITAQLVPLRPGATAYPRGARWAVSLSYHTLWLTIDRKQHEFPIKFNRHMIVDDQMQILNHGY